jgi:hypothetical protein
MVLFGQLAAETLSASAILHFPALASLLRLWYIKSDTLRYFSHWDIQELIFAK